MGKRADIIEGLSGATPALRRYARALCAGAGASLADELVQGVLQDIGARIRDKTFRPVDSAAARIEAYAALTALAARRLTRAARPTARHAPIVHGLADLGFDERAMLLLVSLEGFGYEAAARIVGASREAALARLMRARALLSVDGLRGGDSARKAPAHLRIVK